MRNSLYCSKTYEKEKGKSFINQECLDYFYIGKKKGASQFLFFAPPAIPRRCGSLKLTLELIAIVALEEDFAIRVRVHRDSVQRVQLAGSVEHILIHFTIITSQRRIQLPVWEVPGVDQSHGMRTNLSKQLHDCIGARQLDLAHGDGSRSVEFRSLGLERVQCVQAEKLVHEIQGSGIQIRRNRWRVQGFVEVLDDHVLRVCAAQTVEINEQIVPSLLVLISVLECFESEEGGSPGKCRDEIFVLVHDVEGGARLGFGEEVGEDGGGVVGGFVALEHAAGGLEQVAGDLLGQHVVVAFPGGGGQVVGVPGADAREVAVAVATAGATTDFETIDGGGGSQRLETAGSGVEIGEQVAAGSDFLWSSATLCV